MSSLFSIDAHAGGGPCRVVYGGIPMLRGSDVMTRRDYLRENSDWIRRCLMHEPRGHGGAFGAVLGAPVRETSEFSLIFFDPTGYLTACAHGTLCSIAVWRRMVGAVDVPFGIDNPDGSVTTVLSAEGNGDRCQATIQTTAAVLSDGIELPWRNGIRAGLVCCGNTYVLVDAELLDGGSGESVLVREPRERVLREILDAAYAASDIDAVSDIDTSQTIEVLVYHQLDDKTYETSVLFNKSQIDRSPCGTGSGALNCLLLERGEIKPGEEIVTYGPANLPFTVMADPLPDGPGVQVRISATAYITGVHEWVVSADDPLSGGMVVKDAVSAYGLPLPAS